MDEYVKEALDVVKAQAGVRNMTQDEITSMAQTVADRIRSDNRKLPRCDHAKLSTP